VIATGQQHRGGADVPYHLESAFSVAPWQGVVANDLRLEPDGRVSFAVAPVVYPRTYASPFRFVHDSGDPVLCKECTFRPWAKTAGIASAVVTVTRGHGPSREVPAYESGGRWYADVDLRPGESAYVAPGGVLDDNGETNGTATAAVSRPRGGTQ
jgi:hypothetical protein